MVALLKMLLLLVVVIVVVVVAVLNAGSLCKKALALRHKSMKRKKAAATVR